MTSSATSSPQSTYFFSPWIDFLLIGGFSLLLIATAYLFIPREGALADNIIALSFGVSFIINYPHFAYSYQLLYSNLSGFLTDKTLPAFYRLKVINAAFIMPVALIILLAVAYVKQSGALMADIYSFMIFTVGWHYAKQGYGMLIVMSAKKGFFFTQGERNVLLFHTHVSWLMGWALTNRYNRVLKNLMDISPHRIMVPEWVVVILTAGFIVSFVFVAAEYFIRLRRKDRVPPTIAVVGYAAAIYLWNLGVFAHPIFVAFVPALHSLQYTMFVVKYKKTESEKKAAPVFLQSRIFNSVTTFLLFGILLGALGFFFIPYSLDYLIATNSKIYGHSFFIFCFTAFINTHHYFIDNVLWRKENKKVRAYL
jgi:hypothetical protein